MVSIVIIGVITLLFAIAQSELLADEAQREKVRIEEELAKELEQRRVDESPITTAIKDGQSSSTLVGILQEAWSQVATASKAKSLSDVKLSSGSTASSFKAGIWKEDGYDDHANTFLKYWHELVSATDPNGVCLNAVISFLDAHEE